VTNIDRREVALDYLSACTDDEVRDLMAEARGDNRDVKQIIHREMDRLGMKHTPPIALNSDAIVERAALGDTL